MAALPLIPVGRKSSGEDDTLSRARQENATRGWAEAAGVELADFVWEPHVKGASDWKQRGLGEAIARVKRGEAAGIVVEEQSRLSRENMKATAEVWEALQDAGARLVCTAEGLDTANGDQELSFSIRAALSREQWKQYARRMEAVKRSRIDAGIPIGPVPFGYIKNEAKRLEVDPVAAAVVRELFELRADGASWGDLASVLDERTGRRWSKQGATGIIRSRAYLGELVYGDLVNEDSHEPIVDAPLWHAAQRKGKTHARSGPKSDRWLLSGMLTCGSCHGSMVVWTGSLRERGTRSRAYRCSCRACTNRMRVNAPVVERWVVDTLWSVLGAKVADGGEPELDLTPLVEAVATAERRLEQALAPEAQDALGDRWAATVKERRQTHEDALQALGEARQSAGARKVDVLDLRERWDDMTTAEQRDALANYAVEGIIINGREPKDWELVLR